MGYLHPAQVKEIVGLAEELRGSRGGGTLEDGNIVATDPVEDGRASGRQLVLAEIRLEELGKWFIAELALETSST